jgi:hypothetical protein
MSEISRDKEMAAELRKLADGLDPQIPGRAQLAELGEPEAIIAMGEKYAELQRKFDREVEAHRENCKLLYAVEEDRRNLNKMLIKTQGERDRLAHAFMALHNLAKSVVGPKA